MVLEQPFPQRYNDDKTWPDIYWKNCKLENIESGETAEEWSTRLGHDAGFRKFRMQLQESLASGEETDKVAPHVFLVREVWNKPALKEDHEAFPLRKML